MQNIRSMGKKRRIIGRRAKLSLIISLVSCLLIFLSVPLFATLTVSNLLINVEVGPGGRQKASFKVTNKGDQVERVQISLRDWDRDAYGRTRLYKEAGKLSRSLSPFIDYAPANFTLEGGESKKVDLTVSLPKDEQGPHWGLVLVQGKPQVYADEPEKGSVTRKVLTSYGVKVQQVDPTTSRQGGQITSFGPILSNPHPRMLVEFENTGTTFLSPHGRVEIRDETGKTVEKLDIRTFYVLPNDKIRLGIRLPTDEGKLSPGQYIALAIIDFGGDYLVAKQSPLEIGKSKSGKS